MSNRKKTAPKRRARAKNRLAELRARGIVLSQNQVGKLTGCDGATVSRHESGERSMTREQIIAYAELYGVPTHELFVDIPVEEAQSTPVAE